MESKLLSSGAVKDLIIQYVVYVSMEPRRRQQTVLGNEGSRRQQTVLGNEGSRS
jgi:hypothetical protein